MALRASVPCGRVSHMHAVSRGLPKARRCRVMQVRAVNTVADLPNPTQQAPVQAERFPLVCPICLTTEFQYSPNSPSNRRLHCPRCARDFPCTETFLDLTLTSGVNMKTYAQKGWAGQETFRNPAVSFLYERGWRQSFAWAGFPGADKEYDMAMQLLKPANGGTLVDLSCGSGLFTRRFARSNQFSGVIAADFSETMLQQAKAYLDEDKMMMQGSTPVALVRADAGRLPFATGSIDAIHAGAAIHCWPNPQAALGEISRVLKPGGVFVASTFLVATAPLGQLFGDDFVRPLNILNQGNGRMIKWWEESELRELAEAVGLQGFNRTRFNRFIMFSATKPGKAASK